MLLLNQTDQRGEEGRRGGGEEERREETEDPALSFTIRWLREGLLPSVTGLAEPISDHSQAMGKLPVHFLPMR